MKGGAVLKSRLAQHRCRQAPGWALVSPCCEPCSGQSDNASDSTGEGRKHVESRKRWSSLCLARWLARACCWLGKETFFVCSFLFSSLFSKLLFFLSLMRWWRGSACSQPISVILCGWDVLLWLPKQPFSGLKATFEKQLIQHRSCSAFHLEFGISGLCAWRSVISQSVDRRKTAGEGKLGGDGGRQPLSAVCSFFSLGINITRLSVFCSSSILKSLCPPNFLLALNCISQHKTHLKFRMGHHLLSRKYNQSQWYTLGFLTFFFFLTETFKGKTWKTEVVTWIGPLFNCWAIWRELLKLFRGPPWPLWENSCE